MKVRNYIIIGLVLFFSFLVQSLTAQECGCTNCPQGIFDNQTTQVFIDVSIDGPDDLAQCQLEEVCFESINHTWVGDLAVTLTSPSGLNYIIMGDVDNGPGGCGTSANGVDICVTVGTGNPITNNTQYVCNGVNPCLGGDWTMPCGGVTDPVTGALQAPNCDLNDFNVPGDPVNGTWILTINDVCGSDIGDLGDWSLSFSCPTLECIVCEPEGGNIPSTPLTICDGNGVLSLPPSGHQTDPDYSYTYIISQNDVVQLIDAVPDLSSLTPGVYQVCGFSYSNGSAAQLPTLLGQSLSQLQIDFSLDPAPFCADFSNSCTDVTINMAPMPITIDTSLCIGDCFFVNGQPICSSGTYPINLPDGCIQDYVVTITPLGPFTEPLTVEICSDDCFDVPGQGCFIPGSYNLFFPGGSFQGCDSTLNLTVNEIPATAIISPNPPPPLDCSSTSVILAAGASTPSGGPYQWTNENGDIISTDPQIFVTEAGDYTLTIFNDNNGLQIPPCEDMVTVTVIQDPSGPMLQVLEDPTICEGEMVDLSAYVIDVNGGSTITFHSNTPPSPINQLPSSTVMPIVTTTYFVLADQGNCSDETMITVFVNPTPVADFMVESPICADDFSTVEYIGNASPNAFYQWDFGAGTASPGFGPGPHDVVFPGPGIYTISLIVDENGCSSMQEFMDVEVLAPLDPPIVSCTDATSNFVEFSWSEVPGATGYEVFVVTGQTGVLVGNTSYIVDGLVPGEVVTIVVTALGDGVCGDSESLPTDCPAESCPDIVLNIFPVGDICLDANATPLNLMVDISGGSNNGAGTWSGDGIIDAVAGTFDPFSASTSPVTITYMYTEDDCDYDTTIDIVLLDAPTADFTATSPICLDESSTIEYSGNANPNANYIWNFDGGNASPGIGQGPHTVDWSTAGLKTLSLTVEENNCFSEPFEVTVEVVEPLPEPTINCNPTTTSIEFFWDDILGATSYNVTVTTGQTGVLDGTTFTVDNLDPNEEVIIVVEAIGNPPCPSSSASLPCFAEDCEMINVTAVSVDDICLDGTQTNVTLTASNDGTMNNGTYTWAGDGIIDVDAGIFDPNAGVIGANNIIVTYTEGNCTYNASVTINVFAQPTADFTATSPICETNVSVVNYMGNASSSASFVWDFDGGTADPGTGSGPHQVTWTDAGTYTVTLMVDENGCTSQMQSQTVQVDPELGDLSISCASTLNSVTFTWNEVTGATGYNVTGAVGMMINDTTFTVDGLNPGDVVNILVEAISGGECINISQPADCTAQDCATIAVSVLPIDPICLTANTAPFDLNATTDDIDQTGSFTFTGDGITDTANGTFDPNAALLGSNTITVAYDEDDCSYSTTINISVNATPTADFSVLSPICVDSETTVTYDGTAGTNASYTWDFAGGFATPGGGQGPNTVSWDVPGTYTVSLVVTENGCPSDTTFQTVVVDAALVAPVINCNESLDAVEFIWTTVAGATGYQVNITSGQTDGMFSSDTSYVVSNLDVNEMVTIDLIIETNAACGNITTMGECTSTDCPPGQIDIINPSPICLDQNTTPFTLEFTTTIQGDSICFIGSCIPNPKDPIFDPTMGGAGINDVTVTVFAGDCTYSETIQIEVVEPLSADFTVDSPICISETATVTYTGAAPAGAIFDWNFGLGVADPGVGAGPHEVSWGTTGMQPISLIVTDQNGCASEENFMMVQVDEVLPEPLINCSSTTTSVLFFWNEIPGAIDYAVTVNTGQTGMMTSDTSFEVTNLTVGTMVEIEVIVIGNTACGTSSAIGMCTALDCPTATVAITPVDAICFEGFGVPMQLEAMVDGNDDCIGMWSGSGIIDAENGIFDMVVAGIGEHIITYECVDGPCEYTAQTTIVINAVPVADFTFDDLVCINQASTIEFSGTVSSNNVTYNWNFGNGVAVPGGNSSGPHQVTWSGAGTQTVTLIVEENDCTSSEVVYEIEVENPLLPPVIDCNTTTESIEFVWNTVAGASSYNVTVLAGNTGTQTSDTTYLVTGLNPLDVVSIEVEVVDDGPCDNAVVTAECTAVDCPDVVIEIENLGPFCFDGFLEQQSLIVQVTGDDGMGTGTWSGAGITNPIENTFDPTLAGIGQHQLIYTYQNGNCSYNESIVVNILAAPVADAGLDQVLTCEINEAQLGGSGTSVGATIVYDWSTNSGTAFPGDSTIANPIITEAGVYTLTVTNSALGCSATDEVEVEANQDVPTPEVTVSDASCFGFGDGFMTIDTVINGTPPYLYSFNGSPFSSNSFFPNLSAGAYTLTVQDANGCEQTIDFEVIQPEDLTVEIITNAELEDNGNIVNLGDGVILTIEVTGVDFEELDSVQWTPPLVVPCDTCQSNTIFPTGPTTISVMVQEGNCMAEDNITILVAKDLEIYVPNVFSPNGDGENEFVFPQAKEGVVEVINSFLVFNRWGESVYQIFNIPPNDINLGWNGTQRGQTLDPQVFVWVAEVKFVDGTTEVFSGDVTLVK